MSALALTLDARRDRLGLKGPRAAEWLVAHGIVLPMQPNTWTHSHEADARDALLAARLGNAEFFLEDVAGGATLKRIAPPQAAFPRGVYPVLREDWAFDLVGEGVHDVLAQVCNVNFAALPLDSHPLVMTLMIGVAVLVVPQAVAAPAGGRVAVGRQYRIWCDPSFGPYMRESLGTVISECGGENIGDWT
jgi:sarcosine oxidase, subunit gamma